MKKILLFVFMLVVFTGGCGEEVKKDSGSGGLADEPKITNYTVGGTVNGFLGTVVLQNNEVDDLSISQDGNFTFTASLADGSNYNVSIKTISNEQDCSVMKGSGIITGANITNIEIICIYEDDVPITLTFTQLYDKYLGANTCSDSSRTNCHNEPAKSGGAADEGNGNLTFATKAEAYAGLVGTSDSPTMSDQGTRPDETGDSIQLVNTADVNGSYLIIKLIEDDSNQGPYLMPTSNGTIDEFPALTSGEVADFKSWISNGAKDD